MSVKQVFNTSAELDYPTVLPTLDLDFANTKTLDPRIDFTRASGGSYVGADGLIKYAGVNEARFDHDPETGESLGLLVEEARTNSTTHSEDVSSWNINVSAQVTINQISSPDGNQTADEVECILEGSFNGRVVTPGNRLSVNATGCFSFFAKYSNTEWISASVSMLDNIVRRCWWNIKNGTVGGTTVSSVGGGTLVSQTIENFGNGWYRCSAVVTPPTGNRILNAFIQPANANTSVVCSLGNKIYIWGAQLEAGAFPTSYIPTQASTRTRALDRAVVQGNNFSSIFNQIEGTIYGSAKTFQGTNSYIAGIWGGNAQNRIALNWTSNNRFFAASRYLTIFYGGPTPNNTALLNTFGKIAFSYKLYDNASSWNGGVVIKSNPIGFPIFSRIDIGNNNAAVENFLNGHISRLTYFPKRLPNAQLQALTS